MRIIYLALIELELPGGPTVHTLNLMKGFQQTDAKVRLLCPSPSKPVPEVEEMDCRFIPFWGYGPFRLLLFNLFAVIKLIMNMITFKPEVVYLRDRPGNFFAVIFVKLFRIPYVLEMNGVLEKDFPKKKGGIHWYFRKKVFNWAQGLIFNCAQLAKKYGESFNIQEERMTVVTMHVDCDLFKIMPKDECREKLKIPTDAFVLGYVGGFSPRHDVEILKEILFLLEKSNVKALLLLVGDTYEKARKESLLEGLDQKQVRITGWVPHTEIAFYINAMDIGTAFVKKSAGNDTASFLKVKEYLACGVPVILNSDNKSAFDEYPPNSVTVLNNNDSHKIPLNEITEKILAVKKLNQGDCSQKIAGYIRGKFCLKGAAKQTLNFINDMSNK